ncbi:hypothetical protein BpHYR1_033225 [Brachionus plicatilis]|uniref:Uncharacterized protein n=1 Tax=Brachionus plicatilis TaxID=10195 RepID=A0A3M7PCX4_BRAPC|nr:hypothetical protein BpHYR1_033225 [Brachionus plicatilis]
MHHIGRILYAKSCPMAHFHVTVQNHQRREHVAQIVGHFQTFVGPFVYDDLKLKNLLIRTSRALSLTG